jgi:hypothetical protein
MKMFKTTPRRAVLQIMRIACGGLLACFFLWMAHVVFFLPWDVARNVIAVPEWILGLGATYPRLDAFRLIDLVCSGLLSAVIALTFALGRRRGNVFALLKGTQAGSLMMASLGFMILAIDPAELWIHVTMTQEETGLMTWFTNGADLVSSCLLLALTTYATKKRLR